MVYTKIRHFCVKRPMGTREKQIHTIAWVLNFSQTLHSFPNMRAEVIISVVQISKWRPREMEESVTFIVLNGTSGSLALRTGVHTPRVQLQGVKYKAIWVLWWICWDKGDYLTNRQNKQAIKPENKQNPQSSKKFRILELTISFQLTSWSPQVPGWMVLSVLW